MTLNFEELKADTLSAKCFQNSKMSPRVVFMGSDEMVLPTLNLLKEKAKQGDCRLWGIFSQPDRKSGRGKHFRANPVAQWARDEGIPLFQPEKKPTEVEINWLKDQSVDLIVVMAYGCLLPNPLLALPQLGILNLHLSLLPQYRGASPIESAIALGDTVTGVTLMKITSKMDAGPIADKAYVPIDRDETGIHLRKKLACAARNLFERNAEAVLSGRLNFVEQDHAEASYVRKLNKEDGWLDFNQEAVLLERRVRAFQGWPGCYFEYRGVPLKVGDCRVVLSQEIPSFSENGLIAKPGKILKADHEGISIKSGKSVLCILSLQRPGGKMLHVSDFLRGFPLVVGDDVQSGTMHALVSSQPFPSIKRQN